MNNNLTYDITIKVTHEDVDYFAMKVSKQELDSIKRFIDELNTSSTQVSISISCIN